MARTVRPSPEIKGSDGYAYHATSGERAGDIAKGGLVTHRPDWGTDQDVWPDGAIEKRSYHTRSAEIAYAFAPEDGEPVLLRTPLSAHDFKVERFTKDLYTTKTIKPSSIEILTTDGWIPIKEVFR
jgi:hypothetical protein